MRSATLALRKAVAVAVLAAAAVFASAGPASALDEPRVPENVSQYFAVSLVPRLVDLFGAKAGAEVVLDGTAKVGAIHRVLSWTTAYLSGAKTEDPTQITNTWVAPISATDGTIAGVATVWINPASDQPELADFSSGPALATALATAPTGTLLIRDDSHAAWFATDGTTLTPLVSGSSGVAAPTTPDAYQQKFTRAAPAPAVASPNSGLLIAVLVLGIVVVLLAVFVLLPDRRRRAAATVPPRGESRGAVPPGVASDAAAASARVVPTRDGASATSVAGEEPAAEPAVVKSVPAKPSVGTSGEACRHEACGGEACGCEARGCEARRGEACGCEACRGEACGCEACRGEACGCEACRGEACGCEAFGGEACRHEACGGETCGREAHNRGARWREACADEARDQRDPRREGFPRQACCCSACGRESPSRDAFGRTTCRSGARDSGVHYR
jgi:hypothetical protein